MFKKSSQRKSSSKKSSLLSYIKSIPSLKKNLEDIQLKLSCSRRQNQEPRESKKSFFSDFHRKATPPKWEKKRIFKASYSCKREFLKKRLSSRKVESRRKSFFGNCLGEGSIDRAPGQSDEQKLVVARRRRRQERIIGVEWLEEKKTRAELMEKVDRLEDELEGFKKSNPL